MPSPPMAVLLMEPTSQVGIYKFHRAMVRRVRKRSLVQTETGALASVVREVFRLVWEPRFDGVDGSWRICLAAAPPPTMFLAFKATPDFDAEDFDADGKHPAVQIPAEFVGQRLYVAYARPARLGNFTFVYWYHPDSREQQHQTQDGIVTHMPTNQIAAWVDGASEVTIRREPYRYVRSRVPLNIKGDRLAEAG